VRRVVRTRRGARVEQAGVILSEVLARPGPTHTLFDILAACVAALTPGPRVAVLGFASGGVVAPLRAMGHGHPLEAVDLSRDGEPLFRELSGGWCGTVRLHQADAAAWLRRPRRPFDAILEDLSATIGGEETKPPVSLATLPPLLRARLAVGGVAVVNVLPVPGRPWSRLLPHLARPFARARVVRLERWENRVLLLGDALPSARSCALRIRAALRAVGSREARAFSVASLRRRSVGSG
jgi:hypothetical protein